ncbi:16S rRNA (guanine(966)-N(2))-methyltransferase RsmD [Ectopseudomonas mendocina]|uniref:Ribosomal RNA small subunit methyltransferase D n=1 Tax=Ectopseudomonas mendocina TaxID=300 RepID=A0ABD7RTI7_ECTME|nr:16S rRNA (guanine(966)-N(2))-methyltransferase RsmD [Pseudomonas mendocina]TRO11127.1 16S rRNA (guanine(966)-N(2))-methyltransferase RsmD [Pseudomonas mendocina]TRO17747.1 16S rRNA (guanine(966)-N(2))-methyltransferase RsmD [Pseudomonas mendocina]
MRGRSPQKPAAGKTHGGQGQLRIIGGQWRSRRFAFPDGPGLRPTPDRVRETLFNWLAPYVEGAHVLDPFAGSGALLLEALSRGAASGLACDLSPASVASLRGHLATLQCRNGEIQLGDALQLLARPAPRYFDIVLLDPPFHKDLLQGACTLLEAQGWLADDAWIYTESETAPSTLGLPGNWRLHREKHTGQVHYALWQRG